MHTYTHIHTRIQAQSLLAKYLLYGKAMHRMGDTLFVHGGLNEYNIGWVPPPSPFERKPVEGSAAIAEYKNNNHNKEEGSGVCGVVEDDFIVALGGERRDIRSSGQFDSWVEEINGRCVSW